MNAIVADGDHAHDATAVREIAAFHLHHFALYGQGYISGQSRDRPQIGQVLVGAEGSEGAGRQRYVGQGATAVRRARAWRSLGNVCRFAASGSSGLSLDTVAPARGWLAALTPVYVSRGDAKRKRVAVNQGIVETSRRRKPGRGGKPYRVPTNPSLCSFHRNPLPKSLRRGMAR